MTLSKKIFISFAGLLSVFSFGLATFCCLSFSRKYTQTFNQFYFSVNQSIADILVQLDQETNNKIYNIRFLIQKNEREFERHSNEDLRVLAKKWNVSHLYTIDSSDGKYLTSSCEPPDQLPSVYDYCTDYRLLTTGVREFELTPLVHGNPEHEAYKFFHFPSRDKSKIYEVALHARFLGRTLKKTMESYRSIVSIGLFSPNGDSLGLFFKDQEVGRTAKIKIANRTYPYFEENGDHLTYFSKVASEVSDCCQCKKHMSPMEPNDFSYILRTEVSKTALNDQLKETVFIIFIVTIVALLFSVCCARALSRGLTKYLTVVNNQIFSIISAGRLDEQIIVNGNDEIAQLSGNFNRMIDRLKVVQSQLIQLEINTAIAKTIQMLAHDVRRPFSMLKGLLTVFASSDDPIVIRKMARNHLPDVDRALLSVNGMIEDIMEIGRTGKPMQVPTHPETLIEASLSEVCQLIQREDIEIQYELNHKEAVSVDTLKCQRVFTNIIINAFEAMPKGGTLWFKTSEEENGFLRFCIGNSGSFIEEQDLDHVFTSFYTRNRKAGTGLAIAKKVVNAHGGRIWCESSKQKLTVEIFFTLPISHSPMGVNVSPLPPSTGEILRVFREISKWEGKRSQSIINDPQEFEFEEKVVQILKNLGRSYVIGVVEDEVLYQNALQDLIDKSGPLKSLVHLEMLKDTESALDLIKKKPPDSFICDIDLGLHSMSGFQFVEEARKLAYIHPICIHSNRCLPEDYEQALQSGAQAFLPKPMSRVHLLKFMLNSLTI